MVSFEGKQAQLRRIELGHEQYGTGDQRAQATRFYLDELLDEVVQRARRRGDRRPPTEPRLLISLSGFSPLTTIMAYRLLAPERLLVISSKDAEESIDVIAGHVVGKGRLRQRDFMHRPCAPTDPLGIYRIVKDELEKLDGLDAGRPYGIIDITGGRKVMSAAAALAAWQLGLDLCYIESDYDSARYRPVPGSDRLLLLDNPTALFGEQEMEGALQTFRSGAFSSACERYNALCESLAEPGRARFMRALSDLYRAWCDLDLDALPRAVDGAAAALEQTGHGMSLATVQRIETQLGFLRRLSAGEGDSLLLCFFVLGQHYREVGRHDFAALLFYRTIEGCLAVRLERLAPGFGCERPDYSLLTGDAGGLGERYGAIQRTLGRHDADQALPPVIGLMSAAIILKALDDELLTRARLADDKALSHLNRLATARNRSVLAHGSRPVRAEDTQTFEVKARDVLSGYWALHGTGEDVKRLCEDLKFVRTDR